MGGRGAYQANRKAARAAARGGDPLPVAPKKPVEGLAPKESGKKKLGGKELLEQDNEYDAKAKKLSIDIAQAKMAAAAADKRATRAWEKDLPSAVHDEERDRQTRAARRMEAELQEHEAKHLKFKFDNYSELEVARNTKFEAAPKVRSVGAVTDKDLDARVASAGKDRKAAKPDDVDTPGAKAEKPAKVKPAAKEPKADKPADKEPKADKPAKEPKEPKPKKAKKDPLPEAAKKQAPLDLAGKDKGPSRLDGQALVNQFIVLQSRETDIKKRLDRTTDKDERAKLSAKLESHQQSMATWTARNRKGLEDALK